MLSAHPGYQLHHCHSWNRNIERSRADNDAPRAFLADTRTPFRLIFLYFCSWQRNLIAKGRQSGYTLNEEMNQ
jgi:hypothetical protein